MVTLEPSPVAQVSIDAPLGAIFFGLAPTTMLRCPLSGVVPTTTEASAVSPVAEVATAVYNVSVVGATFIMPLVEPAGAPSILTETAFALFQRNGGTFKRNNGLGLIHHRLQHPVKI